MCVLLRGCRNDKPLFYDSAAGHRLFCMPYSVRYDRRSQCKYRKFCIIHCI